MMKDIWGGGHIEKGHIKQQQKIMYGKNIRIFWKKTSVNSYLATLGWTQRGYSTDRLN